MGIRAEIYISLFSLDYFKKKLCNYNPKKTLKQYQLIHLIGESNREPSIESRAN